MVYKRYLWEVTDLVQLNKFFLSRKTVIAVLLLTFAAVLVGGIVPQKVATSAADLEKWGSAHPLLLPWAERLGLFHVFSTPWFAALLALALASLSLSSLEQFKAAFRKTFAAVLPADATLVPVKVSADALRDTLRSRGYLLLQKDEVLRFARHPWGYWGNFLLHCGILLAVAASLFIALTQQRGVLHLVEGTVAFPGEPWQAEERGLLAGRLVLPHAVRLDRLRVTYGSDNTVERVASDLCFVAERGEDRNSVEINSILAYRGVQVYQSTDYGDAFTLEFADQSGTVRRERLLIQHPSAIDAAGYGDFQLPWLPWELSTKYYADAAYKSMESGNPLLVMRLLDQKREVARVSLKVGDAGVLGSLRVRLVGVEKWSSLIFVKIAGMPLVFGGFLVIVLGSALNYLAAPRELFARAEPGGYGVLWRAARFADFYADEGGEILAALSTETQNE